MAVPPLPTILVSRPEAEERISIQIRRGQEIIEALASTEIGFGFAASDAFKKAMADREKWAKFTIDLLRTLFAGLRIGTEFGSPGAIFSGPNQIGQFRYWMNTRLQRLESIIERLPLFPSALKPVQAKAAPAPAKQQSKDIFIVHGHDEAAMHEVARCIGQLGLHAIILHEQPDKGRTIIEKFEDHTDVGFAVVLLTPDDMGYPKDKPSEAKPRARQNVVLELGYFSGILGRANVCALLKGDIEIPSDYAGVLYTPMDAAGAWKVTLAREIKAAGIDVDLNKLT
jgi:predicted nucleotide-binding protein